MTQYLLDPVLVGTRDEAVEAWHRSLELDPNQPKLRELIEKYRVRQGGAGAGNQVMENSEL